MMSNQYVREVQLNRDVVPSFKLYPFSLPAIRHLHSLELHPAVTYIVGENGSEKSTLLEAIAVAWGLNPEGGSRNFYFETRASHSELKRFITLVKGVRQPSDSFFSAPRAISTSLRKSKDAMPKASAAESSTTTAAARCTNNPTASRLWRSFSTASSARDCTYSMSPKPRSRRSASSPS